MLTANTYWCAVQKNLTFLILMNECEGMTLFCPLGYDVLPVHVIEPFDKTEKSQSFLNSK